MTTRIILVAVAFATATSLLTPTRVHAADSRLRLTVGVYDNAPLSYPGDDDTWTGIYPDIMNDIARAEGWSLEYREVDFDAGLKAVASGDLDMLLAVADSPERRELMTFNDETFFANWGVISTPDASDIQVFTDLDGRAVGVVTGDIYFNGSGGLQEMLNTLHIEPQYVEYPTYAAVLMAVADGEVEAGLTSRLFAEIRSNDLDLQITPMALRPSRLAIAFPSNAPLTPTLISAIDSRLAEMIDSKDSTYHRALRAHVFSTAGEWFPAWAAWALGVLVASVALIGSMAWYLRAQVRRRTAALTSVSDQLRTVVDAIPDAYIRLDRNGVLLEARDRPGIKLTFDPQANIGQSLLDLLPNHLQDLYRKLMKDTRTRGWAFEEYAPHNDDSEWREVRATATEHGGLLLLIRDITEAHRLDQMEGEHRDELEKRVAERTAELTLANQRLLALVEELRAATRTRDHFVANVSHEFRTPLNSILGFSTILSQGLAGELNEEQQRQVEMIHASSQRLASLVEDILALERIGAGVTSTELTSFDACELVCNVANELTPLAQKKSLAIECDCTDRCIEVFSDERLLAQILINLLGNAIKFTVSGGIQVHVDTIDDAMLEVSVTDTGVGIEPRYLEEIFNEFSQLTQHAEVKPEGTGLGLSISRRTAELLGGTLTAQSTVGEGSTFTLLIPLRSSPQATPENGRD
ncbi:MAG: transporter substrate-binding domain-containing protein [Coriobacteriia bacterium]|nr:transporter substrate-binding domain-containing protein [Coriobacteriia bacterium]MBN2822370.1 transporter substrate-binding domain-containing protein [Coriobacteriia bacterium]